MTWFSILKESHRVCWRKKKINVYFVHFVQGEIIAIRSHELKGWNIGCLKTPFGCVNRSTQWITQFNVMKNRVHKEWRTAFKVTSLLEYVSFHKTLKIFFLLQVQQTNKTKPFLFHADMTQAIINSFSSRQARFFLHWCQPMLLLHSAGYKIAPWTEKKLFRWML